MSADVEFTASSFGGGWLIPISEKGREALEVYFDEPAVPLAPVGAPGYIIEPGQTGDIFAICGAYDLEIEERKPQHKSDRAHAG